MPDEVPLDAANAQRLPDLDAGRRRGPMDLAIAAALRAGEAGEVPVGAVVTDSRGAILAVAANSMRATRDASAHAELVAMREAAQGRDGGRLEGCALWVTLEPCAMCAAAAGLFRMDKIVFGAYDIKGGGIEHGARIFNFSPSLPRPEIVGGVRALQTGSLLVRFFQDLRGSMKASPARRQRKWRRRKVPPINP